MVNFNYKKSVSFILILAGMLQFPGVKSQNNYENGNKAYIMERDIGFNPVTVNNGEMVYEYDSANKVYRYQNYILIPDLTEIENGNKVDENIFFGFGTGGVISDTCFTWDKQTISGHNEFDVKNMFVSPVSSTGMNYAKALQHNSTQCGYANCHAVIDGPVSGLAYPEHEPHDGFYDLWTGEELINAGNLKETGLDQKISQQQMKPTENMSYCVSKYGKGWRLPTDMEVGHFNDNEGVNNGLDSAYMGISEKYLWTSSLYKTFTVKRWATKITDGYWENCGGFLYVQNYVRCVFPGYDSSVPTLKTGIYKKLKVNIYPNPSDDGKFYIDNDLGKVALSIYNIQGKLLEFYDLSNHVKETKTIDLGYYGKGIFIVVIESNDKTISEKLIVL